MSSLSQARQMRASLRRVKAGGERFLGGVLPGATSRRLQTRAFADDWAAANLDAKQATGPLWIVLGDSASQGLGATTREAGYVGVVHEMLRRRDAWRVVNLSRSGAGLADVLARQLPELAALTEEEPAALVTCFVGAEDVARRTPGLDVTVRSLLAALPRGPSSRPCRCAAGGRRHQRGHPRGGRPARPAPGRHRDHRRRPGPGPRGRAAQRRRPLHVGQGADRRHRQPGAQPGPHPAARHPGDGRWPPAEDVVVPEQAEPAES